MSGWRNEVNATPTWRPDSAQMSLPDEIHKWSDIKSFILNWYFSHWYRSGTNMWNDCWQHRTVCNKRRVLIGNECCKEPGFLKWMKSGPSKFVNCSMWIYYYAITTTACFIDWMEGNGKRRCGKENNVSTSRKELQGAMQCKVPSHRKFSLWVF